MSYKYETHMHTLEASGCATSSGAEMVEAHMEAGYAGMIVTDHFFNGYSAVPYDLPWEERINLFCKGYENAYEAAKDKDFDVFFGWEWTYKGMDFLTYGLDKEFLLAYPDMLDWPVEKYFDMVHRHGGFLSHAHPFRIASYIGDVILFPDHVDAVEIVNGSHRDMSFDIKAKEYADKHSLLYTAGSDGHHGDRIIGSGMVFKERLKDIHDFIEGVKSKDYRIEKIYLT